MLKNIIFCFIPIFLGCATPQGKLTTITDYLKKNEQIDIPADTPKEFKFLMRMKSLAKIEMQDNSKNFVFMPNVVIPLLNYKFKSNFGSKPNFSSVIELRVGMAYDRHLHYEYNNYYISFPNAQKNKFVLPGRAFYARYSFYITSINVYLAPINFKMNLILNDNEIKTVMGAELVW